jgi:hypothetical protein
MAACMYYRRELENAARVDEALITITLWPGSPDSESSGARSLFLDRTFGVEVKRKVA